MVTEAEDIKTVCPNVKSTRDLANDGIDAVSDPRLYSIDKGGLVS